MSKNGSAGNDRKRIYIKSFYRKNRICFFLTILTTLCLNGMQILLAVLLKGLMDAATNENMDGLWKLTGQTIIYVAAMVAVMLIERQVKYRFMKRAVSNYRNQAFEDITRKGIASFGKENTSNYISALTNDVSVIEKSYLLGNFSILAQVIQAAASLALMFWYSWSLSLVVIGTCILPVAVSLIFGRQIEKREKEVSERNAKFMSMVKDLLNGLGVIKSFQAQDEASALFYDKNHQLEAAKCNRGQAEQVVGIMSMVAGFGVQAGIFIFGVYLSIRGQITPGVVIAFVQMMNYIISPIQQLPGLLVGRKAALGLIDKMAGYGENESEKEGLEVLSDLGEGICLEHVDFSYGDGAEVLKDVNVRFEAGKSYAVVGGSGSGKSTLLNLVMGNHSDYRGSITLGGREIKGIRPDSIFDIISVIHQSVFIFDDTIRQNICMFKEFDKRQVDQAISMAGLAGLIEEKGEDYACGEGGAHLSGGEKQRISIARSLLRKLPVLLADEATSSLDAETADSVTNAILDVRGLTRLVVTHRLDEKTLNRFDEIIVMKNGRIVEQGDFGSLMERKKYFYSLYTVAGK